MEAPRDDLTRAFNFFPSELDVRADKKGDGLTLTGYAAVFDTPTRIDSWEGKFDEQIAPGAFKRSIDARTPVIQFDHGHHPLVGSIPLGSIKTLREDRKGLFIESRLHDNWLTQPVRDAIASGSIDGMSFRFQVIKDTWDESGDVPLRTLQEVKLHELGPVVFPAYDSTSVGVRSLVSRLGESELRDLAEAFRDALGTSDEPAREGTSEEPASDTPDPQEHSGSSIGERAAFLRQINLQGVLQ